MSIIHFEIQLRDNYIFDRSMNIAIACISIAWIYNNVVETENEHYFYKNNDILSIEGIKVITSYISDIISAKKADDNKNWSFFIETSCEELYNKLTTIQMML